MKKFVLTKWQCEKCLQTFNSEEECMAHERKHSIPIAIMPNRDIYGTESVFPHYLSIEFDSGEIIEYTIKNAEHQRHFKN